MYVGGELDTNQTKVHRKRLRLDVAGRQRVFIDVNVTPFAQLAKGDLLDTNDVCRILPCARRSVYRWLAEGLLLPAGKVGREYYFTKRELIRMWDQRSHLGRPLEQR